MGQYVRALFHSVYHNPSTNTHPRTPPQALHPPTPPPAATTLAVKQQTTTATPPPPHPKTPTTHLNKAPTSVGLCPSNSNRDILLNRVTCLNRDMEVRREVNSRCTINSNSRGIRHKVGICSSSGRSRVVGLEVFVLVC